VLRREQIQNESRSGLLMSSYSKSVDDDGTPARALDVAGRAVRDFNHRSFGAFRPGKPGWEYPSNAHSALGELTYLAGGLPQAFEQIIAALRDQLEQGHITIDRGTEWDGHPAGAVAAASAALERASQAAHQMYRGIADAQTAINAAAYIGPDRENAR
jgi:hypothetical protein